MLPPTGDSELILKCISLVFESTTAVCSLRISHFRQKEAMLLAQAVNLGSAIPDTAVLDSAHLFVYPFTHARFGVLFADP